MLTSCLRPFLFSALCCFGLSPSVGWSWDLNPGDIPLSTAELTVLPGQSFVFFDDGEAQFGEDGAYSYTYSAANGGGTAWGSYRISEDGSICVDFINGATRCDIYVHSNGRLVLITEEGQRFPVR